MSHSVYTTPWAATSQKAMYDRHDFTHSKQEEMAEARLKQFQKDEEYKREREIQPLLGLLSPNNKVA